MEPSNYNYPYNQSPPSIAQVNSDSRKRLRLAISIAVGLLVVWIVAVVISAARFHLVGTNPALGKVTNLTTSIKLSFNRSVDAGSVSISTSPSVTKSVSVSGRTITIALQSLNPATTYSLTLKNVAGTSGGHISNKVLKFQPQVVNWTSLNKSQQQSVLNTQTHKSATEATSFIGFDALIAKGLPAAQEYQLQQAILKFNQTPGVVAVDPTSIVVNQPGPNSTSMTSTMNFNVTIAKTTYKATLASTGLTQVELYLYNSTGQQVFDSGPLSVSS